MNPITGGLPLGDQSRISSSRQCRLECEALFAGSVTPNFFEHQAPCTYRGSSGDEWREPHGDQVGVDEPGAARLVGQELLGKRGLSGSVRTGDDDHAWILCHQVRLVRGGGQQNSISLPESSTTKKRRCENWQARCARESSLLNRVIMRPESGAQRQTGSTRMRRFRTPCD